MPPLPGWERAVIPQAKFAEYSMNEDNPNNHRKADAWKALGFAVDDPEGRLLAALETGRAQMGRPPRRSRAERPNRYTAHRVAWFGRR